ncbi:KTSC domain-containing protein [Sphingomonadaceae bacterium KCTC 52780]|uniref:KTSC domain-containing protein n=1 Tax=Sphingosinicella terrae TaxID=2172047 RepID=UPI000E0CDD7F
MPSVPSWAMHRVEYDEDSRRLDIWFKETGCCSFRGVPVSVYSGLLAAPSKGRYFNQYVRDRYG